MFNWFFDEYKNACNLAFYKMKWYYILMLVVYITSTAFIFTGHFGDFYTVRNVSLGVMVVDISAIMIITTRRDKRDRNDLLQFYRKQHYTEVISLMKSVQYNLFSIKGIEWLIANCESNIKRTKRKQWIKPLVGVLNIFVLPLLIPVYETLSNAQSEEKIFAFTADYMITFMSISLIIFILGYSIYELYYSVVYNSDNNRYCMLKDDLEYIKTQSEYVQLSSE